MRTSNFLYSWPTLRGALARGEICVEEIAQACLDRIAERDSVVAAWAFIDPELVLAQARALDRAPERGPLHGMPMGIKDVIDTRDMPTQMGSPIYAGYRPVADAACVALARAAGALIVGKTVTAEFAGVAPGGTVNPLDPRRTPGGSSSGSGAAVADGMVPVALGTQTGGSVHRPASYCGTVGFKPSQSAINRAGIKAAAERFDTVGILARNFGYVDALFSVLTNGSAPRAAEGVKPERVGLCRTPFWSRAQPETMAAVEGCAAALRSAGVTVDDVVLPPAFDGIGTARAAVNDYQRPHALRDEWQRYPELFSPQLAAVVRRGLTVSLAAFEDAIALIERCRAELAGAFGDRDVLLAPCVDGEAPMGLASTGEHHFQSVWTTIDVPTASVPGFRSPSGMPVGIQLVARTRGDIELLRTARWVSAAIGGPAD